MAFLLGGYRPPQQPMPMQPGFGGNPPGQINRPPMPQPGFGSNPPGRIDRPGFGGIGPDQPMPFQPQMLGSYDKLGKSKTVRIKKGGAYKLKSGEQVSGSKVKLKSLARAK
jgi:hypothetical protein